MLRRQKVSGTTAFSEAFADSYTRASFLLHNRYFVTLAISKYTI